jgi:hypothetical protein
MHSLFWLDSLKGKDLSKDLGIDGKLILEWSLGKYGGKMWAECMWLRIGTSQWQALVNMIMNLCIS